MSTVNNQKKKKNSAHHKSILNRNITNIINRMHIASKDVDKQFSNDSKQADIAWTKML